MSRSWVEVADSLCPLIEKEAADAERAGTVTAAVVEAVHEAGLFELLVPRHVGGAEASMTDAIDVVDRLCAADPSTGWTVMANVAAAGVVSAYLDESALEEVFGPGDAVLAGMLAPKGSAIPVTGGFTWSGRYSFGSGCAHATWLSAGALVRVHGTVQQTANGRARVQICCVPRAKVELRGNWNVFGLAGTGSYDFELAEQFVPERFTFSSNDPVSPRSGSTYQLGFEQLGSVGHGAVAVGIGRRALAEIAKLALTKRRPGHPGIGDQPIFLHEFAHHDALWRSARLALHDAYADGEATARAGQVVGAAQRARMRQAVTHATDVSDDVVRFAYKWSGSDGLRDGHPLGRYLRDMAAATQHVLVDANTLVDAGRTLVDEWAES
jgi:indole-3-acetate monooxygenase